MAWTERYMDASSSGGDGTTSATSGANAAWADLGAAIAGVAAGHRVNIKAGTYANTTTSRTLSTAGTTTAPIWWRGYKTTIGDQDANNVATAGTDIPLVTFSTGQMVVSGAHQLFSNISVTSACVTSGGAVNPTATGFKAYRFRVVNSAANANARAISFGASTGASALVACWLEATTTADRCLAIGASTYVIGCTLTGGIIGVNVGGASSVVSACVFDNQEGDSVVIPGSTSSVVNCSIYSPKGHGINVSSVPASGILIANCHFEDVNQASKYAITNSTGANTNLVTRVANSYRNCTGYENGFGDSPAIFDAGEMGGSGFATPGSQDFDATDYLKAIGFPGLFENTSAYQGYLDNGAVQRQEPAGGGGTSGGFVARGPASIIQMIE
jgi:hypothetical protein